MHKYKILSAALFSILSMGISASALTRPSVASKSLYDRLGGQSAIVALVNDFVSNVAADTRISSIFIKTKIGGSRSALFNQVCAATGGPCSSEGMKTQRAGLGIGVSDTSALVSDLGKTLQKFKVPKKEQKELVAILTPMKKDIMTR